MTSTPLAPRRIFN